MFLELSGVAIVVGLGVYTTLTYKQKKKNELIKSESLKKISQYGEIIQEGKYTLFIKDDKTFELLFYYVPTHADLTINSRSIWEVRDSTKIKLINQSSFLSSKYSKIVVIYPTTTQLKRYINENELEFIKYNKSFYDMFVLRNHDIVKFFEEVTL